MDYTNLQTLRVLKVPANQCRSCLNNWLNCQGFACVCTDLSTASMLTTVAKMCTYRGLDGAAFEFSLKSDADSSIQIQDDLHNLYQYDLIMCHKDSKVFINGYRCTAFSPQHAKSIRTLAPNVSAKFVGMMFDDISIRDSCQSDFCPNYRVMFVDEISHLRYIHNICSPRGCTCARAP
jgi:hypothetical protein